MCSQRPELTAVDAQVLLQVVFVLEGLGTLGALELAGAGGSSQTCRRLQNVTLRQWDKKTSGWVNKGNDCKIRQIVGRAGEV